MSERAHRSTESLLAGNGAPIVRELALAKAVQTALARLYQVDDVPSIEPFVEIGEEHSREALFLRETDEGLELSVRLPRLLEGRFDLKHSDSLDRMCQVIEGVSHFLYVSHRANCERSTSQLELEIQAEVDKYVVLAGTRRDLSVDESRHLRHALYNNVNYTHSEDTPLGERYRLANRVAHDYVSDLEARYVPKGRFPAMRAAFRSFFRSGCEQKMRDPAAP